jgi:hypothetical protein
VASLAGEDAKLADWEGFEHMGGRLADDRLSFPTLYGAGAMVAESSQGGVRGVAGLKGGNRGKPGTVNGGGHGTAGTLAQAIGDSGCGQDGVADLPPWDGGEEGEKVVGWREGWPIRRRDRDVPAIVRAWREPRQAGPVERGLHRCGLWRCLGGILSRLCEW